MRDLLKSLSTISEGETKDTKTGRVHKGSYGSEYETDKEGNEVKKATPAVKKGRGRPKKDADETGEVKKYDSSALSAAFGGGQKPKKEVGTVSKKHSLKEYMESVEASKEQLAEAGQLSVKPMPGASQIIGPGGAPIGTADAQTAQMIKQAADQGKLNIGGQQEVDEAELDEEGNKPDFKDVDKGGDKKESWKKAEKDKKKVAEGRDHEASEYLDEKVAKILAREKPGMATVKSNDEFYAAIYNELIACGLTPKAARYKVSYDEDFISDVASAYNHYQQNPSLDEGLLGTLGGAAAGMALGGPIGAALGAVGGQEATKGGSAVFDEEEDSIAKHTQHGLDAKPSKFVAVDPKQAPTPWSVDPIQATTDRVGNFISSLGKKDKTFEGTDMKDMQVESWEKQLSSLLNEGITVSSSQGQEGQPNSVSVTATDNDADALLSVLRNAGIGGFGAEQPAPEIGYGVAQGGEEEATGTGTTPQAAPDVVGDGDDMLSLIKKLTGASGSEVVAIDATGDEEGSDYEDEEGSEEQPQTLEPADGDEEGNDEEQDSGEESEEGSDDKEETDEGNAFTGKLNQTQKGGEFKMGDKTYTDKSSIEEGGWDPEQFGSDGSGAGRPGGAGAGDIRKESEETCNECGMMESECECDHEHEQVEENFANAPKDPAEQELLKLKALLSMGDDMHKLKSSQATGNIQKVTMEGMLNDWKKLSGIK